MAVKASWLNCVDHDEKSPEVDGDCRRQRTKCVVAEDMIFLMARLQRIFLYWPDCRGYVFYWPDCRGYDDEAVRELAPNPSMDVKALITMLLIYLNGNHDTQLINMYYSYSRCL